MAAVAWPDLKPTPPPSPYAHVTVTAQGRPEALQRVVCTAFEDAMAERTRLTREAFLVSGFSGRKFRIFMNALLGAIPNPRYIEIGLFHGASFCPAIFKNDLKAVGIDYWPSGYGANPETFMKNLQAFRTERSDITILDKDFRTVDFTDLGQFNVLFYDGSHAEKDQYDGIMIPQPALDETSVLVVDDWNWDHVRRGTLNALRDAKVTINYTIEVRTSFTNTGLPLVNGPQSEWHNGCFVAVVTKTGS